MVGTKRLLCMYLSFAGAVFFFLISLFCFFGMEALHLKPGTRAQRGFQVLWTAILYGGIACYIYYKKYMSDAEEMISASNDDQQLTGLRERLVQDY